MLVNYGSDSDEDEAPQPVAGPSTTVTAKSPLAGVKLNTASPRPSTIASPKKEGKRRESSASPPPYAAHPAREGNGKASIDQSPRAAGVQMDSLAEFGIPPISAGPCKPSVEAKLANFHHLAVTRGLHFNDSLSASKAFRNPRIYAKLVEFVDVDETGTNWPKSVWSPHGLPEGASAKVIGAFGASFYILKRLQC
ncbi:SAP30-binding protein, transcriptional regulator protein HCNGP [Pseudohyphozyma bogoriensis]|nr:SAP30-binding protein, transcriptional regulator protein HCNGP [Pseudohyphozyma bogoriensis]